MNPLIYTLLGMLYLMLAIAGFRLCARRIRIRRRNVALRYAAEQTRLRSRAYQAMRGEANQATARRPRFSPRRVVQGGRSAARPKRLSPA
jgi:hypothetical protein